MFNSFMFIIFMMTITFTTVLKNSKTLVDLFFFTEILWIFSFVLSVFVGSIFDDVGAYGLLVIILFLTAFEAGLLFIFIKSFPKKICLTYRCFFFSKA